MNAIHQQPRSPSPDEASLAGQASRLLSTIRSEGTAVRISIDGADGQVQMEIPSSALRMLLDLLTRMAEGRAVTIIPHNAELTTQQAADLLNVSRPFVIKLIDQGKLECRKVGRHRRIRFDDLMALKKSMDDSRTKALDDLTRVSQDLGAGY